MGIQSRRTKSINDQHTRSISHTTLLEELENTMGRYWKTLHIAISWTQHSAGVSYPIFSNISQDLSYVKERTILSVRNHLEECNAMIHLNTTYVQHPLRKKDVVIMNLVNTQTIYKVNMNQKEKINCVRMFLWVQHVSQISTVDGTNFVPKILEGDDSQLCYRTNLTKHNQERPGKHSWML